MQKSLIILFLAALGGCTANVKPSEFVDPGINAPTIYLKQLKSDQVQIDVSGKIYEGEWSTIQCTFDTCPEKYKLLTKRHRAHSHSRAALLKATDGSQLECEWISHQAEIDGVCLSADGQKLRLKEYNARKP